MATPIKYCLCEINLSMNILYLNVIERIRISSLSKSNAA